MPESRCKFCYCEDPKVQAQWMRPEAIKFMARNRNTPAITLELDSKVYLLAKSLCDLRVLKFMDYNRSDRIVTYTWTDYGRALLQELKAA